MYRRVRQFSLIHFALIVLYCILLWCRRRYFISLEGLAIFAGLLLVPLLISLVLRFVFRKHSNTNKVQWLPFSLGLLTLAFTLLLTAWLLEPLNNQEKINLEGYKAQQEVKGWLRENTQYPDSYEPLEFTELKQYCELCYPSSDPEPLAYLSEKKFDYGIGLYFLDHKAILKNKSGNTDSVSIHFQLTAEKKILNVYLGDEWQLYPDLSKASYPFRTIYGNDNRNLELEVNGYSDSIYLFRYFNAKKQGDWQRIVPYQNGKINGTAYYLKGEDTVGAFDYKYGLLNGFSIEFCDNGNIGYKGRTRNGKFNGLATAWYCNGVKSSEGYRVNNEMVGVWRYFDENGHLKGTRDFGHAELLDSLKKMEDL